MDRRRKSNQFSNASAQIIAARVQRFDTTHFQYVFSRNYHSEFSFFGNVFSEVGQCSIPSNKSRSICGGDAAGIARINVSFLPSQRCSHLTGPLKPPPWLA